MEDYSNQPRKISFSFNDVAQYLVVLFIAKFFKSFGIYLCYDLLKQIHLVQLLFFSFLFASIFFLLLQNPFNSIASKAKSSSTASSSPAITSNKPLNKFQYYRIAKYSLVQVLIYLLWLFGLTQCGPLRTTLIFEQSEIVVLCALKAIFLNQTNPSRTRAVIILLTATIILFAFDNDDYRRNVHVCHVNLKF
jgi:zinc transporter 5/7